MFAANQSGTDDGQANRFHLNEKPAKRKFVQAKNATAASTWLPKNKRRRARRKGLMMAEQAGEVKRLREDADMQWGESVGPYVPNCSETEPGEMFRNGSFAQNHLDSM